jgi:hypothetical protein
MRWFVIPLLTLVVGCSSSAPSDLPGKDSAAGGGGSSSVGGSGAGTGSGAATAGGTSTTGGSGGSTGGSVSSGGTGGEDPVDQGPVTTLTFNIDRSALPPLYFNDITLMVDALDATSAQVLSDGTEIESTIQDGKVVFSAPGTTVDVKLTNVMRPDDAGAFTSPILKNDKKWAFSFGFDDNTSLKLMIDGADEIGYKGTLFLIGQNIGTGDDESWNENEGPIIKHVNEGWSIGNHSWEHSAVEGDPAAATISARKASEKLDAIIDQSERPDYLVTAFAAPVFDSTWLPVIQDMAAAQDTNLLFVESGLCCPGGAPMVIDPEGTNELWVEIKFNFEDVVGRNTMFESDGAAMITYLDERMAVAAPGHALWMNCLAHGTAEGNILPVIQHVHDVYGPDGTDEVWAAPSDEIYAYLLIHDKAVITYTGAN